MPLPLASMCPIPVRRQVMRGVDDRVVASGGKRHIVGVGKRSRVSDVCGTILGVRCMWADVCGHGCVASYVDTALPSKCRCRASVSLVVVFERLSMCGA